MKKKQIWLATVLMIMAGFLSAVERIQLSKPVEFGKMLDKNNVFLKMCLSFDAADGYFYFLDSKFGTVFKVEEKTGKLVKTISSKGQGPFELQNATSMRVKNNKIFVLDGGFNGIKIFDTEGNNLNEIKLNVVISWRSIDVNDKEEIFLGRVDTEKKTLVSVFNAKGENLRSIVPVKKGVKINQLSPHWYYHIRLDKSGNVYVLFYLMRKLAKYSSKGNLIWEKSIKNEILDRYPNNDRVWRGSEKTVSLQMSVHNLDTTPGNNVVIGHIGGGCMFSGNGELKKLISFEDDSGLIHFRVLGDRLINLLLFGQEISIYKFKEE